MMPSLLQNLSVGTDIGEVKGPNGWIRSEVFFELCHVFRITNVTMHVFSETQWPHQHVMHTTGGSSMPRRHVSPDAELLQVTRQMGSQTCSR